MIESAFDWRTAISVLLPDDVEPGRVRIVFGPRRVEWADAAAVVRIGAKWVETPGFPTRYRFRAFPPYTSRLRFLLPHDNQAAVRHMFRPHAERERGVLRVVHRILGSLPPRFVAATSLPVEVLTRSVAPTLARMDELVPGADLGCFFNRTNVGRFALGAFDADRLRAIAKVVMTKDGGDQLDREAAMLRELSAYDQLRGYVPQLRGRVAVRAGEVLLTDAFHGYPAPTAISPALEMWLHRCRHGEVRPVTDSAIVRQAVERATKRGEGQLAQRGLDLIAGAQSRPCVVHGDFAPWNIVTEGNRAFVFDWEYGLTDGIPAWDALFFVVQVGLIASGWTEHQLASAVRTRARRQRDGYSAVQYLGMAIMLLLELRARYRYRHDHARERIVAAALTELAHSDVAPTSSATQRAVGN
jgi:hypothetical protein